MEITVKYFGIIADITQKKEELFFVENDSNTLKTLQSEIEIKYPKILDINYSVAINKKIANRETELKDRDEVAFLPPFAGG
ncbi:MoaD/ThiS family protein [Flavobacterium wongokense]|uniref:MoaD/ThiS family protein n=1 Tax=Flavobacterium wongokense TaxID=2910674 RepID=UPI001F2A8CC4|nr:MoaD/ThiS family protein [Flavobacterium sp. WG47]MCF6132621.1 MoaD/ThiS family protein [Flavobacterium sp. WG47]